MVRRHKHNWALVADRSVGSFFVVASVPTLAFSAGVVEGEETDRVQAFGPDLVVEGVGERVVRRLIGTAEVQSDAVLERP